MRLLSLSLCFAFAQAAQAGGYDTPMLYAGEHMGMGGAAVAAVDDPSALFHNPAGLAQIKKGSALVHVTYLSGTVTGSPGTSPQATSITSQPTSAPFPLLGFAYRLHPKIVLGLGAFPIASAGATYVYDGGVNTVNDSTTLIFAEAGPALALDLGKIRLGLSYRYTYMMLERYQGGEGAEPVIDFTLTGSHNSGFRVGLQADLLKGKNGNLSAGLNYRHQVIMRPSDPEARALGMPVTDVTSRFMLPSRIVAGLRFDEGNWGVAADVEYGFNSQNQRSALSAKFNGEEIPPLANIFGWRDALTYRFGVEHRLANRIKLRLGGAYDETTSNKSYPTAFGTPPAPTTVVGGGLGKRFGALTVDFSMVRRRGQARVSHEDLSAAEESCVFCSKAGNYAIDLFGTYLSFGYDLN